MEISNSKGLKIRFLNNGTIQDILAGKIKINLKSATGNDFPGSQLFLRIKGDTTAYHPLLGPKSSSKFIIVDNIFISEGTFNGLDYQVALQLSESDFAYKWTVNVSNNTRSKAEVDVVMLQEVGLKNNSDGLVNEYYVAQYIERIILKDKMNGNVLCCRQNTKEATGHPWFLLASGGKAQSAATDGLQFFGNSYRTTGIPEGLVNDSLGGDMAGESPIVSLQEKPVQVKAGASHIFTFYGYYKDNHPEATSENDLKILEDLPSLFSQILPGAKASKWKDSQTNLFHQAPLWQSDDLTGTEVETYFGKKLRHKEQIDGQLLSFFYEDKHVVLKEKENLTDRPHAHILQAQMSETPTEKTMSTTCFATGVFNSHISQGNTNFNVLLSVNTSPFNTALDTGQRIFVRMDEQYYLLGMPSAFEMGLNSCRWLYKKGGQIIVITTGTSVNTPVISLTMEVLKGDPVEFLISHKWDALNGWEVKRGPENDYKVVPAANAMIREKFSKAAFRIVLDAEGKVTDNLEDHTGYPGLFVLQTAKTDRFSMSFVGEVTEDFEFENVATQNTFWETFSNQLKLESSDKDVQVFNDILPWYGLDAMIHYLTPYGLEQFSGAAWGTRDVAQGPVELLLSLEKYDAAREVLLTVFANQNPSGDWPQWWMFDSYNDIRAADCHGDVYYWIIIALSNYINTTGDLSILSERRPYYNLSEKHSIQAHMERLITFITDSFVPGTSLAPFGGGDWNDSLQPVNEDFAKNLISSWTVQMNYQAFKEYAAVYERMGNKEKAENLSRITAQIKSDFNTYLMKDGIVAGYGHRQADGSIKVLLHPSDTKTGIHYSLLPMDRGILSGIFTREQAECHQKIINSHLKGPDGARLMDKPLTYKGGIQEIFQRAESSTFFGREIGLMYIHEHIRYAETQAVLGNADAFIKALRQAVPIAYADLVNNSGLRQANCYYSSSDVNFKTRYEADEKYGEVLNGNKTVNGGWRVYSSGPGIFVSLVIKKLIGFRATSDCIVIDPVLTKKMDGLIAHYIHKNHKFVFEYHVKEGNFHPKAILINGHKVDFTIEENPYRTGGAVIPIEVFEKNLNDKLNTVAITL